MKCVREFVQWVRDIEGPLMGMVLKESVLRRSVLSGEGVGRKCI